MNSLIEGNRCHNATCINYHKTIPVSDSGLEEKIPSINRHVGLLTSLRNGWLYAEESNDDVTVYLRTKIIIDIAALFS
ncbi:hypothetical protein DTO045G8_3550 [Paecilomyces variotii]|nr:hypothetical protein DTO045G8_3550 [Paecilomyces variotii]